ncbi:SNF2-related protein [Vreelandella alkaliphila]|uniref:SNF2-related protein n=1 Tax=Vreelandella alkaliphila TaxID=272774 RepID=A0AAJ2RW50_9GAMM|nr:SNF2-related protein [Halomonas alkaliphila]MDX5979563.1 SNF2-related protein [Halomonas alkaliphila]
MSHIFERTATPPVAAAVQLIRQSTAFGVVVSVLQGLASETGNADTADSLKGQMQFGLRKRGQKARKEVNAMARAIVARVAGDPSLLTDEERNVLMQYSGRGGIQGDNSLSEYFTPTPIAEGVWDALAANGFENGNVLEPSTGAGVFLATKPKGTKVSGAEIDETSSSVAALLHPDEDVTNQSFEQLCATANDNSFDSVIGNVPFGDARGKWAKFDPDYQDIKEMERYFVTRAIDKVRHGGLIALIVPPNIVSKRSKAFVNWRRDISRKAEFLGAHKLPSGTFGGANGNGTDTIVDVLIMRKHGRDLSQKIPDLPTDTLVSTSVYWDTFIDGRWFEREGKRFVHGEIVEGFRTRVESEIDNEGLKRLLARKFDSRIDYAALDTAETITRNYLDGDRRIIGMQMHELVAGEWQKMDAHSGIFNDGRVDTERFGVATQQELEGIVEGGPTAALSISAEQAKNATQSPLGRNATASIKNAVTLAYTTEKGMRERVYRAALIGAEISQYARQVSETGQADDDARERLQRLVTAEVEQYGNPAKDARLRQVSGPGASNVAAFARSMTKDGGFSDLLTGKRTGERGQAYELSDPAEALRYVSIMAGNVPIPLDLAQAAYTGDGLLTLEKMAAHDSVAITADGLLQPMEYFASGNVVHKLTALERAMAAESSPAIAEKMQRQVDAINAKRKFTDVDNIVFSMRDKWYDRKLIERFLDARGYGSEFYYDAQQGRFVAALGAKLQRFEKQLFDYLNGLPITSSKAEKAAEYKQQARDLEEEFNVWLRQHDDIDGLVARYNDVFNDHVPVEYDGSDLQLENVADWITPHDYQAAGVRRLSDEGRGILAFDVGLGKTLAALSLAQYNAQKGRAKRTCVVVPSAVLENWYHETRQFHKSMAHVHFVGFTPKSKGGEIEREPVLDEEGNPKIGRNGEVQYRDVLSEDSAQVIYDKINDIPQTSKTLIVISRDRFGMIPLRPDTREAYADRMVSRNLLSNSFAASLAQGEDVKLGRNGNYDAAKKTERYQQKFNDDGTRKKGEYPFFEDMGFDSVIVDEGHEYKNTYQANGETQRLAYLPTPVPAKRSVDMAVKMDHLRSRNNGAGPVMLTATPVTNSPVEIYNMLSHIVPAEFFERMGISNVDDFVQHFCQIEEVSRTKLSGEVVTEEGVAGFQNLDALRNLFHRFTNMKSAEDVNDADNSLKMPESTEVHATVDMTPAQAAIYEELRQEADAINQKIETLNADGTISVEEARPVFAIIRDMDRITTDMDLYLRTMTFTLPDRYRDEVKKLVADLPESVTRRLRDEETGEMENVPVELSSAYRLDDSDSTLLLVVPEFYEQEVVKRLSKFGITEKDVAHPVMPKYAKLLDNLRQEYERGGKQIVFTEEKSQHDKIKRIITHHLPITSEEIGIINADTAKGDKLEKISNSYNTGKARIIIANKKAEVGVNLQKGTTAIHHLTLPWTPASIQQRNGRGVRQGNTSANVDVIYYMGKGSFDGYRLESLKRKSSWIKDLFYGDAATAENANAGSDDDMAIMLAANPEEARERIAAQRKRQADETRARANRRASIDLANLQKHKAFLANYESAENRAAFNARERGRDEDEARTRMQAKREKTQAEVRQLESRLVTEQEKGRIDLDAKRLISDGEYLATLSGEIVEQGQVYEDHESRQKDLYRVDSINLAKGSVTLKSVVSARIHDRGTTLSVNRMGGYRLTTLTAEQIDQRVLTGAQQISYTSLQAMAVDDAFLRERGEDLLNRMTWGHLVVADANGELVFADRHQAREIVETGGHVAKPRPAEKGWRGRAMAAAIKGRRDPRQAPAVDGLAKVLFGEHWLAEAMQAYGNPAPQNIIVEAVGELLEKSYQAAQDFFTNHSLGPIAIRITRGEHVNAAEINMTIDRLIRTRADTHALGTNVASDVSKSLAAADYDADLDALKEVVRRQAIPLSERLIASLEESRQRLINMLAAKKQEREAEAEAERQAATARIEQLSEALPEGVRGFFSSHGIEVKLNSDTTTWQPKGGGRRKPRAPATTSQPGERFMLFDPRGKSGHLANILAGNKSLQSRYNATWTIFDENLWWHMPADGIDYDALMEAFA